jgi:hypothetical protein
MITTLARIPALPLLASAASTTAAAAPSNRL